MPRISMRSTRAGGVGDSGSTTSRSVAQPVPRDAARYSSPSFFTSLRLSPLKRPRKLAGNGKYAA